MWALPGLQNALAGACDGEPLHLCSPGGEWQPV